MFFFCGFQFRVESNMNTVKNYPKVYINKEYFPNMDSFFVTSSQNIENFFASAGNIDTFRRMLSNNVDMLCIFQKTTFRTQFSPTVDKCTFIVPHKDNQDKCALIMSDDDMILVNK